MADAKKFPSGLKSLSDRLAGMGEATLELHDFTYLLIYKTPRGICDILLAKWGRRTELRCTEKRLEDFRMRLQLLRVHSSEE